MIDIVLFVFKEFHVFFLFDEKYMGHFDFIQDNSGEDCQKCNLQFWLWVRVLFLLSDAYKMNSSSNNIPKQLQKIIIGTLSTTVN